MGNGITMAESTELVNLPWSTERNILDNFKMGFVTDMVLRSFPTVPCTRANSKTENTMAMEFSREVMGCALKAGFRVEESMAKAELPSQTGAMGDLDKKAISWELNL